MKLFASALVAPAMLIIGCCSASAGVLLGAHVGHEYVQGGQEDFLALENAVGRKFAIDNDHEDWAVMPDAARVNWDIRQRRIPMISWRVLFRQGSPEQGCATADAIVAGVYDNQLEKQARATKAFGIQVLVRFNYEMTTNRNSTCFTGFLVRQNPTLAGSKFVEAWKHVVNIFRSVGATNAKWIWAPSRLAFTKGVWQLYYPGNDYVDWIGVDDYNHFDTPRSFADDPGIDAFYDATSGLGKPLMIAETGAVNDPSQNPDPQALWISTARQYLKSHPAIKAFLWWNDMGQYGRKNPNYGGSGYVLQGQGLAAFKAMASDPYFQ
jgi:hypothetical protein